jgi:hypothetical protein
MLFSVTSLEKRILSCLALLILLGLIGREVLGAECPPGRVPALGTCLFPARREILTE